MWRSKRVLITGGASFIGSHLADLLLKKGAEVVVADDFSSGKLSNLEYPLERKKSGVWIYNDLIVYQGDLKDKCFTSFVMKNIDVVFHLAALHGGRGYINTHPAECCSNMILDQIVFEEAYKAGVERICFASSACVYPAYLQEKGGSSLLLKEEDGDPFVRDKAFPDLEYGWAKLMGEMALRAYHRQYALKASAVRIFTAYGPRENETHAIIALIAKAFVKMDPYIIWGSGEQERNFTYVEDIVEALILAAQKIEDGSPVNAGRDDRITINKVVEMIFDIAGWRPKEIKYDLSKPEGVFTRAADLSKAERVLGWKPNVTYKEGLKRTIEWYFSKKNPEEIKANLDRLLLER